MFLFVSDIMSNSLAEAISNNTINATCNGVALNVSTGYFTAETCSNNLTIVNENGATIFSQAITPTLIYTVRLTRFVLSTIRFQRTKNITAETTLTVNFSISNGYTPVNYTQDTCYVNATLTT
jgi:hypothetical protein